MSFIDSVMGFASSLIGMITIAVVIFGAGMIIYILKFTDATSKGTVIFFRPKDKRGEYIPIKKEEDHLIECRETNGIPRRFIKGGNGWVIKKKNIFIGVEGSGYTAILGQAETQSLPMLEVLRSVWGEKFFEKIPPQRRLQLAESKWILDVKPVAIDLKGSGLPLLSSEDLDEKNDTIVLDKLARAVEAAKKQTDLMMLGLAAGTGAGLMLLVVAMKWVKI